MTVLFRRSARCVKMADEFKTDIDLPISLVEQKATLWDKTMDLYKNRIATQAAWKEIMVVLIPGFEAMEEKRGQGYGMYHLFFTTR